MAKDLEIRRLSAEDTDLAELAKQLNRSDSEVSIKDFSPESLRSFLADPSRFYLVATRDGELAGALHGYIHLHPAGVTYAFVDEVDTVVAHRRQGVGTAMMQEAFKIGREAGATELWLGADDGNAMAEGFYTALSPSEIEHGTIYTWKL